MPAHIANQTVVWTSRGGRDECVPPCAPGGCVRNRGPRDGVRHPRSREMLRRNADGEWRGCRPRQGVAPVLRRRCNDSPRMTQTCETSQRDQHDRWSTVLVFLRDSVPPPARRSLGEVGWLVRLGSYRLGSRVRELGLVGRIGRQRLHYSLVHQDDRGIALKGRVVPLTEAVRRIAGEQVARLAQ